MNDDIFDDDLANGADPKSLMNNLGGHTVELKEPPLMVQKKKHDLPPMRIAPTVGKAADAPSNTFLQNKLRSKMTPVPALDFSNLKNVKEYKDWYAYSQKLENAIQLLREKVESLENEKDAMSLKLWKSEQQVQNLTN